MTPVKKGAEIAPQTSPGGEFEEAQIKLYNLIESVNEAVTSIMTSNQPIVVRSCWARVTRHGPGTATRPGRFKLDKEEHDLLTEKDGLYIFIVTWPCKAHRLKIVPGRSLPYQKQYSWLVIWEGGFTHGL